MNTEKVACDFCDWLVEMEYLDREDEIQDLNEIVADFGRAYAVAPRLIHLLADICGSGIR